MQKIIYENNLDRIAALEEELAASEESRKQLEVENRRLRRQLEELRLKLPFSEDDGK